MSRRVETRAPTRVGKANGHRPDGAPADAAPKQRIGARAFVRRERSAQRRQAARRAKLASSRSGTFASLLEFHVGGSLVRAVRRIPTAALVCVLVAFLNAACWSIVSPPFEVPDEPSHFAYVKQLAETGSLPRSASGSYSYEELAALQALRYYKVREQPDNRTIASRHEQAALEHVLRTAPGVSEKGSRAAGVAASEPPLYYALETIPYALGKGGTLLTRLQLMRLTSALLAGLTALFAFLFLREALPREPWAWTVGGLAVALTPLLGFMSGAVNPDSLLFAVASAVFYCLARAFRRGLSTGGATALGALLAIGFLTKLNFIGLVPGIVLGLVVLCARAARVSGRSAYRLLALALAIGFSPVALYVLVNVLSNHAALGAASAVTVDARRSILGEIDYIWQLYLPRIPGTASYFPGIFPAQKLWFDGYVGLYGWLDTTFPGWVYSVALIPAGAIAALCARALYQARAQLRRRAVELGVYAAVSVGLLVLVGAASYDRFPVADAEFAQTRYLLPLIALFGAVLALAARGAGRRWGPVVGTLLVVLFLGHDVFSQLLVAGRFYG
ncbi:MAG TPA: DUF2142 domain-containing protein [Solirubrobacteraceae bacterium]|nr:DUF2142 domain-containing protein [Solirubrobacteraceae bacterium]